MHSKKAFGQHHEKCFGSMNTSLLKSLNADMQITNTKRQYRPKVSRPPIPSGNIIFVVLYWGGENQVLNALESSSYSKLEFPRT